jgi:hypothetical protein
MEREEMAWIWKFKKVTSTKISAILTYTAIGVAIERHGSVFSSTIFQSTECILCSRDGKPSFLYLNL